MLIIRPLRLCVFAVKEKNDLLRQPLVNKVAVTAPDGVEA
jgi:hypothetical protein